MDESLLTVEELAQFLRTSKNRIYNLISQGGEGKDIPRSIRVGRRRLWPKSTVVVWMNDQIKNDKPEHEQTEIVVKAPQINRI